MNQNARWNNKKKLPQIVWGLFPLTQKISNMMTNRICVVESVIYRRTKLNLNHHYLCTCSSNYMRVSLSTGRQSLCFCYTDNALKHMNILVKFHKPAKKMDAVHLIVKTDCFLQAALPGKIADVVLYDRCRLSWPMAWNNSFIDLNNEGLW